MTGHTVILEHQETEEGELEVWVQPELHSE